MAGSNDNFIPHTIEGNDSFLIGYSIYYTGVSSFLSRRLPQI